MNDETKDELMKRTRKWLQSCVNAATREVVETMRRNNQSYGYVEDLADAIERGEHEENSNLSCMLSLVRTCLSTTTKEVANE